MTKKALFIVTLLLALVHMPSWSNERKAESFSAEQIQLGNSLLAAVRDNNFLEVKRLVDQGAPLTIIEGAENPLIRSAVFEGNLAILQYLLDHGAEIETQLPRSSFSGHSPDNILTEAINLESPDSVAMVKALLQAGADPNLIGDGDRADHYVPLIAANGQTEILKLLLMYGADPNVDTSNSYRPLYSFVKAQALERTKLFLDAGADVNLPKEGPLIINAETCSQKNYIAPLLPLDTLRAHETRMTEDGKQIEKLLLANGARSLADFCHQAGLPYWKDVQETELY